MKQLIKQLWEWQTAHCMSTKGRKTTYDDDQHDTTPSGSSDEEERQGPYSSQHQGLHDDWWNYYKHSNDRADQYWPHHRDIMLHANQGR
jgi:hypothetical protein